MIRIAAALSLLFGAGMVVVLMVSRPAVPGVLQRYQGFMPGDRFESRGWNCYPEWAWNNETTYCTRFGPEYMAVSLRGETVRSLFVSLPAPLAAVLLEQLGSANQVKRTHSTRYYRYPRLQLMTYAALGRQAEYFYLSTLP